MATTPPLRASVPTPSTPLHGAKYDRRPRTRQTLSRTLRALQTPPPSLDEPQRIPPLLDLKPLTSPHSTAHTFSPPPSAHTSPRKTSGKSKMADKHTDTSVPKDLSSSSSMVPVGPIHASMDDILSQHPSHKATTTMLPTPVKTPRKKTVQSAAVKNAARVLFPMRPDSVEDAMPTPQKKRIKRPAGFSLYSSMEDEEDQQIQDQIQIYTDSKDKVPELDTTEDNPFYEPQKQQGPPPGSRKGRNDRKRKVAPSAEDRQDIKDAFNREEGMVYVFRGKKIYRKFPKDGNDMIEDDSEVDSSGVGPLTRSAIKPRLLFPTREQLRQRETTDLDDEEATTDIEGSHNGVVTDADEEQVTTPVMQTTFSPATPPTTVHATRSSTKRAPESTEVISYKGKKVSPFDGWSRTKASATTAAKGGGKGKKRENDEVYQAEASRSSKRIKSSGTV